MLVGEGDNDENDDLGSDVEKSFGEAMCVVDTPGPHDGQSAPSSDKTEMRPASAQSMSPRAESHHFVEERPDMLDLDQ